MIFLQSLFSPRRCIPESSSIHSIFCAITGNKLWDSWNYYPLERIVEKFAADDTEIASWIAAYIQDLKSYKVSTKLFDYISAADSNSTVDESEEQPARYDKQYYQKLSIKLKMKCLDQTMDYTDYLWDEIAGLFRLPPCVVLLDSRIVFQLFGTFHLIYLLRFSTQHLPVMSSTTSMRSLGWSMVKRAFIKKERYTLHECIKEATCFRFSFVL